MVDKALNRKTIALMTLLQNDLTVAEARIISNVILSAVERLGKDIEEPCRQNIELK